MELQATRDDGRLFHSRIVSVNKECLYMSVLVYGIRNRWLWPLTVAPGGIMQEVQTATRSFIIRNIIIIMPADLLM